MGGGAGASTGSQVGKVIEAAPTHTSLRMRKVGPSRGERRGARTGEMRAGIVNVGVWIWPEARSRAHKQSIIGEKTGKRSILSGDDGGRRTGI